METAQQPIYDDPNRCVKDTPEAGPCMCPDCLAQLKANKQDTAYVPKGVVVTDANLVSQNPEHRVAWFFQCPVCGEQNIADYNPRCPDCGEIIIFRSHKVTEFLRRHNVKL